MPRDGRHFRSAGAWPRGTCRIRSRRKIRTSTTNKKKTRLAGRVLSRNKTKGYFRMIPQIAQRAKPLSPLENALNLAAQGFNVFPLTADKTPAIKKWQIDATP